MIEMKIAILSLSFGLISQLLKNVEDTYIVFGSMILFVDGVVAFVRVCCCLVHPFK